MKWGGVWIWSKIKKPAVNSYLYARKTFELAENVGKSKLRIAARGSYSLWINGIFVDKGSGGDLFDVFRIRKYLHGGKNTIAVLTHYEGPENKVNPAVEPGLLVGCRVRTSDGQRFDVSTDNSWKVLISSAWKPDISPIGDGQGYPEIASLGLHPRDWREVDFDDSRWEDGFVRTQGDRSPWSGLSEREIPSLAEWEIFPVGVVRLGVCDTAGLRLPGGSDVPISNLIQMQTLVEQPSEIFLHTEALLQRPNIYDLLRLKPYNPLGLSRKSFARTHGKSPDILCTIKPLPKIERIDDQGAFVVLDFGKEVVGFPFIRIASSNGCTIDIGYSEILEDGRVNPTRSGMNYADRVILSGGPEEWQSFHQRSFRYMHIDLRDYASPVIVESIGVLFSTYPISWCNFVQTSDSLINEIAEMCAYTLQLNMQEAFTINPWLDRSERFPDVLVEAKVAAYAFGDSLLARCAFQRFVRSGKIASLSVAKDAGSTVSIAYEGLMYTIALWDYFLWTGNTRTLVCNYQSVKQLLGWFERHQDNDGLLDQTYSANCWDISTELNSGRSYTLANAFIAGALSAGEKIAGVIGDSDMANRWAVGRLRIVTGLNRKLWRKERGLYADCLGEHDDDAIHFSQQANTATVLFDIAPKEKIRPILKKILSEPEITQIATSQFQFYLLQAMWQNGFTEDAIALTKSIWGEMLSAGATSAWQTMLSPESYCSGASTAPRHDIAAWILGVRPIKPGFSSAVVFPQPGNLTYARGVVTTVKGDVVVQWESSDIRFSMCLEIPAGCRTEVVIPTLGKTPGTLQVNARKPKSVKSLSPQNGNPRIRLLEQGKYTITLDFE